MVFLAFFTMLTTAGAMGLPGALLLPLNAEYGWSVADISGALALRIMLYGLMAPFSAALMKPVRAAQRDHHRGRHDLGRLASGDVS